MGDRASVSFKDDTGEESITIFSHWRGKDLFTEARSYLKDLKKDIKDDKIFKGSSLGRLEASRVVIDFIRHLVKGKERIELDLYLGKDKSDGDNSDQGHKCLLIN